jgi:hypothetical protein
VVIRLAPTLSPLLAGGEGECQRGQGGRVGALPQCGIASHNVKPSMLRGEGPFFPRSTPRDEVPGGRGGGPSSKLKFVYFLNFL